MTTSDRCAELRDALTEVALGVADGTTRGTVMAHLATCDRCREELSSLAAAADDLLLLVPEREPSADFEGRVLARLGPAAPDRPAGPKHPPATVRRHRTRRAVLSAVAGVALLALGGTGVWLATAPDRELAGAYRTTLDTANGRYLAAADLTTEAGAEDTARSVGTVFLYEGEPSWAYVVVRDAGPAATYDVVVTVEADPGEADQGEADQGEADQGEADPAERGPYGADPAGTDPSPGTREISLGSCVVTAGACTAGGVLDVPVHDVVSVRLTAPDDTTWATATPRATWP